MNKTPLFGRILIVAASATILVGCAGSKRGTSAPTSTSPPPTATAPESYTVVVDPGPIIGSWKYSNSNFMRFDADGTYRQARNFEALEDQPFAIGQYGFEEDRLVVVEISVSGVPSCGSKEGVYEIRILDGGQMQIVLIDEGCRPRGGDTMGIYERIP